MFMKRKVIMFIPLALLIVACSGQKISKAKVPSLVLNTMKAKYPLANDVEWEKHPNFYEAEFDMNDSTEISTRIDETGKLIMQKQDIAHNDLIPAIVTVIKDKYKDYTIDDVEKIENNGAIYYQVELKGKGKKELNLVFSTDGREEKTISYWD